MFVGPGPVEVEWLRVPDPPPRGVVGHVYQEVAVIVYVA